MTARQSPLHESHAAAGATFTDFGGWEMPVEFDSIRAEHQSVRDAVGKFDVSHMGQLVVEGPDAETVCQRLTTNDVAALDPGEAQYAAITDEAGVMLDDTIVYHLPTDWDGDYLVIPNAGHDAEMADRWETYASTYDLTARVDNQTDTTAMIAVQGPETPALLEPETSIDLDDLDRFEVAAGQVADVSSLVARTGYTGETGFEIVCPAAAAETVWSTLECQGVGLGARDTLRLEMGFLLSGQDFDPDDNPRNPYEAGIDFVVDLETDFVGRDALEAVAAEGPAETLTGIRMVDRAIPRHGYSVETPDGQPLGTVTSGTMSPTLGYGIAMAYLPVEFGEPDRSVRVVVREEPKKGRTTPTPFLS